LTALGGVDGVLLHEHCGKQLVEVKAAHFLSDENRRRTAQVCPILSVKRLAPVLPITSSKDSRVPFTTCEEMLAHDAGRNIPLWKLA